MVEITGSNMETVTMYSVESDECGIAVFDDYYEAIEVAKANSAYIIERRYVFDGDSEKIEDFSAVDANVTDA